MTRQGPAEHEGAQGGGCDGHRLATQLSDRIKAAIHHHLITTPGFIEHQDHHRAALGHAAAEIHRLHRGQLCQLDVTTEVGMHDVLRVGIGRQLKPDALPQIKTPLPGQGKVLVPRPLAHRHGERGAAGGAAAEQSQEGRQDQRAAPARGRCGGGPCRLEDAERPGCHSCCLMLPQ